MTMNTSSSGHSVLVTGGLTLAGTSGAWTSRLDITNNDADIIGGSLATVANQVKQGYNGGTWLGEGITSSTAAGDTHHLTAVAVIQNNQSGSALFNSSNLLDGTNPGTSDILVKYTYYGDANLDGKVDGSDYSLIDNAYLYNKMHPSTPLTGWFNGDFNYDGVINGSDYTLIDNAFNTQGASLAVGIAGDSRSSGSSLAAEAASPMRNAAGLFSRSLVRVAYADPPAVAEGSMPQNSWLGKVASVAAGIFDS
jgi:hypothetical protein